MPEKILIVEDNKDNRLLLNQILKYHGYDVIEAVNGEEGVDMAKAHMPDLILMDIQLPVMDGLTAIRMLKNDPDTRHIKIIAITSFAMKGDRENILDTGADNYIAKPINTKLLSEAVKATLGGVKEER